ncbi:MAG TPA: hypothetical protein VFE52_02700, partial [Devosia sp.]|nr:hypothetical protein [Devosia sp.]
MRSLPAVRSLKSAVRRVLGRPAPAVLTKQPLEPMAVETRHLSPEVAARVEDWFARRIKDYELNGDRSVVIAGADGTAGGLKIKGAGFQGKPFRFAKRHGITVPSPRFDFEGRMAADIAFSHENAISGGASFQQAAVEYLVSNELARLGYDVVPCLGYGRISRGTEESWFSVFGWDARWRELNKHFPIPRYEAAMLRYGQDMLDLASKHRLVGYFTYVGDPADEQLVIKDL